MFLGDAPPEGWRFQQPTASLVMWPTSSSTANGAPSYVSPSSTITADASIFHDSMVGHNIDFTVTSTADGTPTYTTVEGTTVIDVDDAIFSGVFAIGQTITFSATGNAYTVTSITDTTTVIVNSDASGEADGDTVTITRNYVITSITSAVVAIVTGDASGEADQAAITVTADGNYTLPSAFSGEYSGVITYTSGSSIGAFIQWDSEGNIRRLRENVTTQTGYPTRAAIRKKDLARRWELIVYPTPASDYTVEFPYELHFTALSATTDLHPAGVKYDEAIIAACESYAEMKGQDALEGRVTYYEQKALPAARRINRRSTPKKLGSLLNRRTPLSNLQDWRDRINSPDVTQP